MSKINCRDVSVCMLCRYWLGKKPNIDIITGKVKGYIGPGLCAKDETDGMHNADSLCHKFEKSLEYL